MNPPPPMFPAAGCTTAKAKPVATAASTAFPPCCMMVAPALDASSWTLTTMACFAWIGRSPSAVERWASGTTVTIRTSNLRIRDLYGFFMRLAGSRQDHQQEMEASRPAIEASLWPQGQSNQVGPRLIQDRARRHPRNRQQPGTM